MIMRCDITFAMISVDVFHRIYKIPRYHDIEYIYTELNKSPIN